MDSLTLQKIKDLLDKNSAIGIAVGKNPGVDKMGSALALYLSMLNSGKTAKIACPTEPIVEVSSLVGIDQVKTSFDSGASGDLMVSFPYKEGEIEKISYTLESGFLNILVKVGEAGFSFDEKDIRYKRKGLAQGVVFTIGASRLSDLGDLFDVQVLKDTKIINIDNKAENQGYGDIVLVSTDFSSVSEQVASLILSLSLKMEVDIAQNLLSGIISATDNFQNPKTSPLAFETAAAFMKKGAIRKVKDTKKDVVEDSFFTPKAQPKYPSFSKTAFGTEENRKDKKDTASAKDFGPLLPEASKPTEDNPPDDWLAPKIYKGSTSI